MRTGYAESGIQIWSHKNSETMDTGHGDRKFITGKDAFIAVPYKIQKCKKSHAIY